MKPPERVRIVETYDLSPTQEGMLFHGLLGGPGGVDLEQIVCVLEGGFDEGAFVAAFHQVASRHAILRTRFSYENVERPAQEVVETVEIPVESVVLAGLDPEDRARRFDEALRLDRARGIDLNKAPMMRLQFFDWGGGEHRVVWTFHHALLDGRSFPLVLREVFAFYEAGLEGRVLDLPRPRAYREYIEFLGRLDLASSEAYWRDVLAGFSAPTPLGVDRAATRDAAVAGDQLVRERRLSLQTTALLRGFALERGVTLNTLLQTAWALLLHRYSHETDIVFGATRACRRSAFPDAETMVGLFINTLPMRVRVDPKGSLDDLLKDVRSFQLGLRAHEHTPLVKVQGWSSVSRGTPLFETLFVYENTTLDVQLRGLGGSWKNRRFRYLGRTNYPLTFIAYGDDELLLRLEADGARFEASAVERMMGHVASLLEGMPAAEGSTVAELPMLTPAERQQVLHGWNQNRVVPKGTTLHGWFEDQVSRTPDAPAVTFEGTTLSYSDLNKRANRLAHRLRARGVSRGDLVGLRLERNVEIVVGILGILKAGGAYLPMDPAYPKDRVAFMLDDAKARVIVVDKDLAADAEGIAAQIVRVDETESVSDANPSVETGSDDLAYVIYTSGSTGKPKGCPISHYNVTRLFEATDGWFSFGDSDVWTLFHSYAFDFSVWELWGALLHGGRLVVVPFWVSRSPEAFRDLLVSEGVTVLNQTPSAFRQLVQADLARDAAPYALRVVIFGGEALELQALRPWFDRYGDARPVLVNMYGITETTVHVTYRPIGLGDLVSGQGSVIGVPIPDLQVYLLDPAGEPVPIGVAGEMYVGGGGVAGRYLNRAELSSERFVPDSFSGRPGARLYRSGDLARRLENGDLEYLGRIDHQVKIRGFRIELGEIEAAIAAWSKALDVTVVVREDVPGDRRIVAYLVVDRDQDGAVDDLRNALRERLPEYMVPAHFVTLDRLPLTPNGKVDRKALPAPAALRDASRPYAPPRTPVEATLSTIWAAVLRLPRVGIHDPFFEIGGDSILSIQVLARARQAGLNLTARDLFRKPTIAQLAEAASSSAPEPASGAGGTRSLATGDVVLAPIQRWFVEQDLEDRAYWNQAFLFEVPASFDPDGFASALHAVVLHHDALRLRLVERNGAWHQDLGGDPGSLVVPRFDLSGRSLAEVSAIVEAESARIQAAFDLTSGLLLAAAHFDLGHDRPGRLFLAAHHLAMDAVSWRILLEDLESAYVSLSAGKEPSLPPKTTSFQSWSRRLQDRASTEQTRASAPHWLGIAERRPARLPVDDASAPDLEAQAEEIVIRLSPGRTHDLLHRVPPVYRTRINDVLLGALGRALHRWTGENGFLIETEGHGREEIGSDVDVSRTVGWFTTLFPIWLDSSDAEDPGRLLKSVKEQLRRIPEKGLGYGLLRYLTGDDAVAGKLRGGPRPELLFNYLGQLDQTVAASSLFRFAPERTAAWHGPRNRRTHPIEVLASVRDGALEARWIYGRNVHERRSIEALAATFAGAVEDMVAHCLSPGAGGFSPSDFPETGLDQPSLDTLVARQPDLVDIYPLSPMQRLFHSMEGSEGGPGFELWRFRVRGPIDAAALEGAFGDVVARHPMLRTAFEAEDLHAPLQVVLGRARVPFVEVDLRGRTPADQAARVDEIADKERTRGFDLRAAPLFRAILVRLDEATSELVWATHHLYIDGWSWPLVFRDLAHFYRARRSGYKPALGPACAYGDYVAWLRHEAPDSETHWKKALSGVTSPTPVAMDAPGPARAPQERLFELGPQTTAALELFARSHNLTLSTVLQGAWALVIGHHAASRDVVLGAAFSGRPPEMSGVESLVGPCVSNLPVRVVIAGNAPVSAWLASLQENQFEVAQHQYASLEDIQAWAGMPWRFRMFESLVVFQNYTVDGDAACFDDHVHVEPVDVPEATNYPVTLTVTPGPRLRGRLRCAGGRFGSQTADALVEGLRSALEAIASNPAASTDEVASSLDWGRRGRASALAAETRPSPQVATGGPTSEMERRVAKIWGELFGVEDLPLDANFFDLGGHSLLLLRAHARLRAEIRPELGIVALLQHPTVRSLARHLGSPDRPVTLIRGDAQDRAQKQREALQRQRRLVGQR